MRKIFFLIFLIFISSHCFCSHSSNIYEIKNDDITIQYPEHLADLAQKIMPDAYKSFVEENNIEKSILLELQRNKESVLNYISNSVGMETYSNRMSMVFDSFITNAIEHAQKTTIRLWDKNEVLEIIQNGGELPSFTYDKSTGTTQYKIEFRTTSLGNSYVITENTIPIVIDLDHQQTPHSQALVMINAFSGLMSQKLGPGILCHEVAEIAIVSDIGIRGAFTRWFSEGAANCIAAKTLEKFIDKESADKFLSYYSIVKFDNLKDTTDIFSWRTLDWSNEMPSLKKNAMQETAYYAFSTHEVMNIIDKYGYEVLPKIINHLAKSDILDGKAVIKSINTITGENIENRLAEYGNNCNEPFKGIAVKNFTYGQCIKESNIKYIESNTIPMITDGSHGFYINFDYTTVLSHNDIKVQIVKPAKDSQSLPEIRTKVTKIEESGKNILSKVWLNEAIFEEGNHILKIYFNDILYKDIPLNFVSARSDKVANITVFSSN